MILIFFIGSVSASNENNTQLLSQSIGEVVNEDNTDEILTVEVSSAGSNDSGLKELEIKNKTTKNLLGATNEENLLGNFVYVDGNTFEDIQTAVDSANDGDTIYLNSPYYIGSGTYITIDSKNLTIVGKNTTLDAQKLSGIFYTRTIKATPNFNNITFINGIGLNDVSNPGGGAIYGRAKSIVNCNFKNCSSSGRGGAFYISLVTSDKFIPTVVNCSFENCSSLDAGVMFLSSASVFNCSIKNCFSTRSYGNVYVGSGSIVNCSFENTSNTALYSSKASVVNCSFTNCSSSRPGGAINSGQHSNIVNCSFTNCSSSYAEGSGAVVLAADSNIINCSFDKCSATSNGGAVHMTTSMYGSNPGNSSVVNCSFNNCSSNSKGGAIYMSVYTFGSVAYLGSGFVVNCSFNNCSSTSGGAVYIDSESADTGSGINSSMINCSFNNCSSTSGGAVYIDPGSAFSSSVVNSSFMNCSSISDGGAIHISSGSSSSVFNSTFIDNKAQSYSLTSSNNNCKLIFTFTGGENYINAIYSEDILTFDNITYWNGSIVNSNDISPVKSENEVGINIILEVYDSQNNLVDNITSITNSNGQIVYDYLKLNNEQYTYKAYHPDDTYYTYIETTGTFTGPKKYNLLILNNQTVIISKDTETKLTAIIRDDSNNNTINPSNTKLLFIPLHKL